MNEQRTKDEWSSYERFGSIEARPYAEGDQANPCISFSLADLNRTSLAGGMIARNPANANDQWYIAPDYFAKHYRAAHEPRVPRGPTSVYLDHLNNRASPMDGCDCTACDDRRAALTKFASPE